jgi:Chlorophyllase
MMRVRVLTIAAVAAIAMTAAAGAAKAAPANPLAHVAAPSDPLPDGHNALGYDCLGYRWKTDPKPDTPEWTDRDRENQYCSSQRYIDRGSQPLGNSAATYGQDPYRIPTLPGNDGTRFRFAQPSIPGIPAAEVYRPCPKTGPDKCTDMPKGLHTFDPPYPVVVVFHGFTASMQLHRWTTQALAEAGYETIAVNGTCPCPYPVSTPNSQTASNGTNILAWLDEHKGLAADADLSRVGFAGHSQGGAVILGFQGDKRVSAMVDYDGGTTAAANNTFQPIMYQGEDVGFQFQPPTPSESEASTTPQAAEGYDTLRGHHVDTMGLSFRAWTHTDYNGNAGPGGNRWAELTSNYFTLAWFDRYLKGKLALGPGGRVITSGGRTQAGERAYRQAIAQNAYNRLLVTPTKLFDDSVDIHNISMGFWDPDKAAASGDPLMGGNVPYTVEGTPIKNRLSFYAPSVCYISVPDYTGGSDLSYGGPDSADRHRADSTVKGDMRLHGCPASF